MLDGTALKHVKSEKDIGVTIDSRLKFEEHMTSKINKANNIMGVIRRTFKTLDEYTFPRLFKALVRPHLEYANPVWSPQLKKDIIAVENVQRRATKQLPGLRDLSYSQRLQRLKLPTLAYRRMRGDIIECYKLLTGIYDYRVSDILPKYEDNVGRASQLRGHNMKLYSRRARLNLRKNYFSYRVVDTWNGLPSTVVNAPSLPSFERRLDKHWRTQDLLYEFKAAIKKTAPTGSEADTDEDLDI